MTGPAAWPALALALLLLPAAGSPALAAGCTLQKAFELDMKVTSSHFEVPASLNGKTFPMIVDTGGALSALAPGAVEGVASYASPVEFTNAYGKTIGQMTRIARLDIGPWKLKDASFLIWHVDDAEDAAHWPDTLGANVLSAWDVEFDPAAGKLRLYVHTDCPNPVYWRHTDSVRLPVDTDDFGLIVVPVTLDGHRFRAMIDTGAAISAMSIKTAKLAFGLEPDLQARSEDGERAASVHRFGSLDLDGIEFRNTPVAISHMVSSRDSTTRFEDRQIDMVVGAHQLRSLHFFIAYEQRAIFVTSLAGDRAAAAEPASAAAVQK